MARYAHLPIYKAAYELLLKIMEITKNFPRDYKYTLGEKLQNHILDLIVDIYNANSSQNKSPHIESILNHSQFIGLFLRISMDIRIISEQHYAELSEKLVSISKQAAAWLSKTSETIAQS